MIIVHTESALLGIYKREWWLECDRTTGSSVQHLKLIPLELYGQMTGPLLQIHFVIITLFSNVMAGFSREPQ